MKTYSVRFLIAAVSAVTFFGITACGSSSASSPAIATGSYNKPSAAIPSARQTVHSTTKPEQDLPQASPTTQAMTATSVVNLSQLAQGNYSSLIGTWKDAIGDALYFNGSSQVTVTFRGQTPVTETISVTSPEESVDSGIFIANLLPEMSQDSPPELMVIPKGPAPDLPGTDNSDTTRDRIIMPTNGGTDLLTDPSFASYIYYRISF